ncbi:MAG: ornithine cyclodeaminase family protein [Thermoanaerobaculia bacterium]
MNPSEVRRLLPMDECVELMAEALATLGRGDAVNPLRWGMRLPGDLGILGMMPGSMSSPPVFGLKVVSVFPGNHGTGYDSHQGVVMLFETEHGAPVAIVDASEITAIRTAATSAVATRLLAREDAGELAILGSGVQARTHLEAMLCVRDVRRARVWSPTRERREAFAAAAGERHGIDVRAVGSAEEAVRGADLLCTTTSARQPIVEGGWLAPGLHVNAVGSSIASARELDTAAVVRSRLFVDRRESTLAEAGDFLFPKQEGAIDDDHIVAEIGEILLGQAAARRTADEITLFKSLGLAVEDLAAAHRVYVRAREQGLGTPVELGGPVGH